ncbi:hypothetical protein N9U82_05115 [Prochlorococcus sp. AH-736-N03]|nr:hypothetical protein [Prochlorococcus sp. AH-736-N03]
MSFLIKKLIFHIIFNFSLFLILIIGIQNSSQKRKVNFLNTETIKLPISFIVGVSFISGSIAGSLLNINSEEKI